MCIRDRIQTGVEADEAELKLKAVCLKLGLQAKKNMKTPKAEDADGFRHIDNVKNARRLAMKVFDMSWPNILAATSKRATEAPPQLLEFCFLIYERILQLATAFGVPAAARGATASLVATVASAKKNAIPATMIARAQKLLKEGAPHYIRPPVCGITVESSTVLLSDEEEQRRAEDDLERALSHAMRGDGAPAESIRIAAPPQRLPSSIVAQNADEISSIRPKRRVVRSSDVLHKLQSNTAMMECKHKPTRMIMKLVARGLSAAGPAPNALGMATQVCRTWEEMTLHSSIQISVMPRNGPEFVLMWRRRKQIMSLSFRREMEAVLELAKDGDQLDPSAIMGSLTDTHLMPLMGGITSLKALDLWGCGKVTDMGISKLAAGQPRLKVLCLARCTRITDRGFLALLERCAEAKAVDLCGCVELTEVSVLKMLVVCKKIKTLNLGGVTKLNENHFELTPNSLPALQSISLCGSGVTDKILAQIVQAAPNLVYLDLMGCRRLGDASMHSIASSLHNLTALNVQGARNITDEGVCRLAQGCKLLRGVALGNNDNVTDGGVDALVRGSSLVHLDLRNCKRITNNILESIGAAGSEGLQTLNLSTTTVESTEDNIDEGDIYTPATFSERSLKSLFAGCPALTGVNLGGRVLTSQSLHALAAKCPNLQFVSLVRCEGVDPSALRAICSGCASLTALNLDGCVGISDDEAVSVLSEHPELDALLLLLPAGDEIENPEMLHMKIEASMGVPVNFQVTKLMQSDAEALMEQLWKWAKST
eukprot:TRINITY_DN9585_c0_g2_i5.p1 TRINITY_DN9585_c0_g2~~TRINITY_DN9585_c0_g2_i5.p1  ORF type:complete len:768 (+),score=240.70 TRINITY_DN9585_c0_g2_i5:93-2396(+)